MTVTFNVLYVFKVWWVFFVTLNEFFRIVLQLCSELNWQNYRVIKVLVIGTYSRCTVRYHYIITAK